MAPPIEGQVVTRDTHSAGDHQVCQLEKGFSVPASYEEDAHSNLLCIKRFQDYIHAAAHRNADRLRHVFIIVFLGLYTIYFGFAIAKSVDGAMALIVLTSITVLLYIYVQIRDNLGSGIWKICLNPALRCIRRYRACVKWIVFPALIVAAICFLGLEVIRSSRQLVSMAGMVVCLLIPLVTSKHVTRIRWQPIIWGICMQFILGVVVLRWKPGYIALKWITDQFNQFLMYSLAGAAMAFGDPMFILHPFLMMVAPVIIYLGAVTGLCFHLGLTQLVVSKTAWLMRWTLGTTGIESVSLTASIFFSMLEMIQMFRAYLPKLTKSEFHTFVVGSHATIAGFAYGLFVLFGVSPHHLLTGAVMSAPAAVAIAKLSYPETEESYFKTEEDCHLEPVEGSNAVEAAGNGAWQAGKTMAVMLVQVIAFMSGFEFLDATVAWFGSRVGIDISLRIIFSYLFLPFVYVMGVPTEEARQVSSVLGLKLVTSEILAFMELGQLRAAHAISERSAALTTYAICGFSSLGTLGMMVGVWAAVDKKRARDAASMLPRVYINTNLACFLTACVAGVLYDEGLLERLQEESNENGSGSLLPFFFSLIPSYKKLFRMAGF